MSASRPHSGHRWPQLNFLKADRPLLRRYSVSLWRLRGGTRLLLYRQPIFKASCRRSTGCVRTRPQIGRNLLVQSNQDRNTENVATIKASEGLQPISRELAKLIEPLHAEFPSAVEISFTFRKNLRLHIDVKTLEEAHAVEARLPALCGGVFQELFSGSSPHHAFFHRVSAKVSR